MANLLNKKSCLTLGLSLFYALPSFAVTSLATGWYIDANVGPSKLQNRNYDNGTANSSGFGANIGVGYKFMPYFGVEAGYSRFPNTNIKNADGIKMAYDKHYTYQIAGKGIVPIGTSGVELFGKLGWSRIKAQIVIKDADAATAANFNSTNPSSGGPYFGAGAQYAFMPELAGVLQWNRSHGTHRTGDLDLFTVGLEYLFN